MLKYLKLQYLKIRLAFAISALQEVTTRHSCGLAMADEITGGEVTRRINRVNKILRKIRPLDPKCPPEIEPIQRTDVGEEQ